MLNEVGKIYARVLGDRVCRKMEGIIDDEQDNSSPGMGNVEYNGFVWNVSFLESNWNMSGNLGA